jgi:uncharacterized protein YecT (DUF1311 family)
MLGLSFSFAARADDPTGGFLSSTELPCERTSSAEVGLRACYQEAYEQADHDLNALYQRLMGQADARERELLREMQRAWIPLKDAQCGLVEHYYREARFAESWKTRCEAVMTRRRVEELRALGTGIGG